MRWLSALLVFCLSYTFAHEAVCHGGALDILSRCFSHVGSQHDHVSHVLTNHNHQAHQPCHGKDHHDDEKHDHPLKTLLVKKDPPLHRRILLSQAGTVAFLRPGSARSALASPLDFSAFPDAGSSVPGYLRAHVLRL